MRDAFDLADYYRNPVLVLCDGVVGQMEEPVEFSASRPPCKPLGPKTWATTGWHGDRPRAIVNSLFLDPEQLERHNQKLQAKFRAMVRDDARWEDVGAGQPYDLLLVAYGIAARVSASALDLLRANGIRAALGRPVSLFPFPDAALRRAAEAARAVLVVELSAGQMLEDVRLALEGRRPIRFYGRQGGMLVTPEDVAKAAEAALLSAAERCDG